LRACCYWYLKVTQRAPVYVFNIRETGRYHPVLHASEGTGR
jgi:hypothetical protein